jgi:hypothetical protein
MCTLHSYLRPKIILSEERLPISVIKNITISLLFLVISQVAMEGIFYLLLERRQEQNPSSFLAGENVLRLDSIMGYVPPSDTVVRHLQLIPSPDLIDTLTVYNVQYTFNKNGLRDVPLAGLEERPHYTMFFGCSFAFGLGLEDNMTLPFQFGELDSTSCPYNYAVGGYGPQNMLALLQYNNINHQIRQKSGRAVYLFIDDHIARAIGDMRTYNYWAADLPYYRLYGDSLSHEGSFRSGRKLTSFFYSVMGKSNVLQYFNFNLPIGGIKAHRHLTATIIAEAAKHYEELFGNNEFYVALYPGSNPEIRTILQQRGVKVLDLNGLFDPRDKKYWVSEYDSHPSANAIHLVAAQLATLLPQIK